MIFLMISIMLRPRDNYCKMDVNPLLWMGIKVLRYITIPLARRTNTALLYYKGFSPVPYSLVVFSHM